MGRVSRTFTNNDIKAFQPSDKITDYREGKGFGVRVHPSGAKVFFYVYTFDGRRRFLNLGHYKDPDRKEKGITLKEARQKSSMRQRRFRTALIRFLKRTWRGWSVNGPPRLPNSSTRILKNTPW